MMTTHGKFTTKATPRQAAYLTPAPVLLHDDTFPGLPGRLERDATALRSGFEEELIVDDRSAVSPAQAVENRLSRRLPDASLQVSHLQTRGLVRSR